MSSIDSRPPPVSGGDGESFIMNATATIAPALAPSPTGRVGGVGGVGGTQINGHPQYMRALERANQVRLARAELKRRVATGEIDVTQVLLDCPWEADSMAVADLLVSQRRWGQTRCRKFLAQLPMSEKKTIGSMTDRQRQTLVAMLRGASAYSLRDLRTMPEPCMTV
jgi:hypothetical protein